MDWPVGGVDDEKWWGSLGCRARNSVALWIAFCIEFQDTAK